MGLTTNQHDDCLHDIGPDGMQRCYLILPDGSRKYLVRPVRRSYKHVGPRAPVTLRELTPEEHERYDKYRYARFEPYEGDESATGRFWTQAQLDRIGCDAVTTMAQEIAETYAAAPEFYGATYCATCRDHFPVGADGEFVWLDDGSRVGT